MTLPSNADDLADFLEWHFQGVLDGLFAPAARSDEELAEHLADTPRRMARAWLAFFEREEPKLTCFAARDRQEFVIECDIPFHSFCAHHMLPFYGHATVGYLPDQKIIGLSKLSRIVDYCAAQPNTQEKLTSDIANYLMNNDELAPQAVGVLVKAQHMCVHLRGVEKHGVNTVTSALRGSLREDAAQRQEFLTLCRLGMH